ncbi:MAG: HD domain-containing phosphohydrolase [Usitatibacter sp.]
MEPGDTVEQALARCRSLYADGKSVEAIPVAHAALTQAREGRDMAQLHRALNACGILAMDTLDVVRGIDFHLESLRLAERDGHAIEAARAWNNIGIAFTLAGSPALAVPAYAHAIESLETTREPISYRYGPYSNTANALFQLFAYEDGLRFARRGFRELKPEHVATEILGVTLLNRNIVNLLVATGRVDEAAAHIEDLPKLESQTDSPRVHIAAMIARATYELATGRAEVALTRFDAALARAREMPSALRDTLACIVRAEEIAGSPERALARLDELSQHVYATAIAQARHNIELADLDDGMTFVEQPRLQAQARLRSRLSRPEAPDGWDALRRLAVTAGLKLDATGWHGIRVGALTKALALACGEAPLRALEIGLAAELHDVGMLSVPEGVLAKHLVTDCEFDPYYRHTDAGADILREEVHPRFLVAREVARYHHAWWDGNGYPRRVGGKSIPPAARMCAVADTYDELVCGFRAKKGMGIGKALLALQKKAGTQLDPELVHCFTAVVMQEVQGRGLDPAPGPGLEAFQRLIAALQQDRGVI